MSELQELLRERQRIEERIRELKNGSTLRRGSAKIDVEHYPTQKPDRHYAAIRVILPDSGREVWRTVISGESRRSVAEKIPGLIKDLEDLLEAYKEAAS